MDFQVLEARKRTVAATFLKIIIMVMVTMVELKAGYRDEFIRRGVQITRETLGSDFNGQSDMGGSTSEPI